MKRIACLLSLTVLLTMLGIKVPLLSGNVSRAQQQQTSAQASEAARAARLQEEKTRRRNNFKPSKTLLLQKGVPFEPDDLLEDGWEKKLAPAFAQMPEMQLERRGSARLKGVQLSDTLYLPGQVELVGDTVILTRRVIFEGRHVLIKGNYSVAFFPHRDGGGARHDARSRYGAAAGRGQVHARRLQGFVVAQSLRPEITGLELEPHHRHQR